MERRSPLDFIQFIVGGTRGDAWSVLACYRSWTGDVRGALHLDEGAKRVRGHDVDGEIFDQPRSRNGSEVRPDNEKGVIGGARESTKEEEFNAGEFEECFK